MELSAIPVDNAPRAAGTCLLCHTIDQTVTSAGLLEGATWLCPRCGQRWDKSRLDAASAYARYVATH